MRAFLVASVVALRASWCSGQRDGVAFDPENAARYLPPTLNATAGPEVAEALGRFEALVASAGEMRCASPLPGHKRTGFGSYLRILCHEAELSLARGRVPEPFLLHDSLSSGAGRVESGGPACGRRELGACVFASRFAAAAAGKPACAEPPAAARRRKKPPNERGRAGAGAKRAVAAWEAWAGRHDFWSSAAVFAALLRPLAALERVVAAAKARAGLAGDAPRPWIGVHLRRGDACREGAYMGRTCSDGDAYAREAAALGRRYGFGTLVVATDSDAALAELARALPAHGWPATAKVVASPAPGGRGRQDDAKRDARIEDLMASGVVDAADEFAAVLVDVALLSDCDAFVGKFTSNIDRLVYPLLVVHRRTLAPYASLDTAWSKDTPAIYEPKVHGPLQAVLAAADHKAPLRNLTRKKLHVEDCAAPRAAPGWSAVPGSRWWCPVGA